MYDTAPLLSHISNTYILFCFIINSLIKSFDESVIFSRATIPDPEDKKPEDWDKPEHIPDPDAQKPEDWDDEMDGMEF